VALPTSAEWLDMANHGELAVYLSREIAIAVIIGGEAAKSIGCWTDDFYHVTSGLLGVRMYYYPVLVASKQSPARVMSFTDRRRKTTALQNIFSWISNSIEGIRHATW
jgi:hypothetical protein